MADSEGGGPRRPPPNAEIPKGETIPEARPVRAEGLRRDRNWILLRLCQNEVENRQAHRESAHDQAEGLLCRLE